MLLAACVGGPKTETAPLAPATISAGKLIGGETLALSEWGPDEPAAVILALHGYGDYAPSVFDGAATFWAARNLKTYAYDQRGFGRNDSRANWPGAERLIEDAIAAAAAARTRHPGKPLILIGHSMGGGVALAAAPRIRPDKLILAAPAVWGGDQLALPYRALAWAGAGLFPDKRWTGEGIVEIQASDNIPMLRRLGADPLILGAPSSREFMGLIRLMDRAVSAIPDARQPTLTLFGDKDEVTSPGPILAAHDALPGPKRLIRYPLGWHMLFRDLQAETVWADVATWIEERS